MVSILSISCFFTLTLVDLLKLAPDFASWQHMYNYLQKYADQFNVTEHIRFGSTVISIDKDDLKSSEKPWTVKIRTTNGNIETFQFDFVVVANGLFSTPHMPKIRGQEKFIGSIIHTSDIKSSDQLANKRVVIIGGGKSAIDIATVAGTHSKTCHMIFRHAAWGVPERMLNGLIPGRFLYSRVFTTSLDPYPYAPKGSLFNFVHRFFPKLFDKLADQVSKDIINSYNPKLFEDGIYLPKGSFRYGKHFLRITDEFIRLKSEGRIIGKLASVEEIIDGTTIRLDSGECLEADMIVYATGFIESFPFLSDKFSHQLGLKSATPTSSNDADLDLYRHLIPVGIPNIAFVGFIAGALQWLMTEVSSHWVSDYFLGRIRLPTNEKMYEEIQVTRSFVRKQFDRTSYYVQYYWLEPIEIYLQDMGLSLHRTNNWISEYFGIYRADRLKNLHEERRRRAEKNQSLFYNHHWYLGFGHTVIFLLILFYIVFFIF